MTETLKKLLTIKSIVTMALTAVFCVLSVTGVISGSEFLTVFATVIAFYFGTQTTKNVKVEDVAKDVTKDVATVITQDTNNIQLL